MTETKAPDVADLAEPIQVERPWWLMPVLLAWIVLVLAGVLALTHAWDTVEPTPAPAPAPSPSSSAWSDECTAEDLEDGACYTWDDIREQPTYSQGPDGPVLVTP